HKDCRRARRRASHVNEIAAAPTDMLAQALLITLARFIDERPYVNGDSDLGGKMQPNPRRFAFTRGVRQTEEFADASQTVTSGERPYGFQSRVSLRILSIGFTELGEFLQDIAVGRDAFDR